MRRAWRWLLAVVWLAANFWLWAVLPPRPRLTLPAVSSRTRPVVTADGRRLVIKAGDRVETRDLPSGRSVGVVPCPPGTLDTVAPSPDGRWLLAYDGPRQELLLIDLATGRQAARTPIGNLDDDLFGRCCRFTPDGRVAALVMWEPTALTSAVRLWDVEAGSERAVLRDALYPVQFAADGRTLAATARGSGPPYRLQLWDVASGQLRRTIPAFDPAVPYGYLAFSPDGRGLLGTGVAANGGWWVVTWDVATGQVRADHGDAPIASWAPDGLLVALSLATPGGMRVEIRDPGTGVIETVQELNSARDAIWSRGGFSAPATLSDDGRFVLARLSHPAPAWVRWLAQRVPAFRRLAPDTPRPAVHVWEARTGRPMAVLWRDTEYALLTRDGRTLVTVEADGAVQLWDVPPHKPWAWFAAAVAGQVMLLGAVIGRQRRRAMG
jgi:hypothetical protein